MLAVLPSSEDEETKNKEEDGMVTLIVTIHEELLRMIETSGNPNFSTTAKKEGDAPKKNESGWFMSCDKRL